MVWTLPEEKRLNIKIKVVERIWKEFYAYNKDETK